MGVQYPYEYKKPKQCGCGRTAKLGRYFVHTKIFFCTECLKKYCIDCGKELTDKELKTEANTLRRFPICVDCINKRFAYETEMKIHSLQNALQFQLDNKFCQTCRKLNDNRNEKGLVVSRYCLNCSQAFLNSCQIRRDMAVMKRKRPKNIDKRRIFFDKVTGFRAG